MTDTSPHTLTNGRYRTVLTSRGGGGSFLDWMALSRWDEDPLHDAQGFFIYLRDAAGNVWSACPQPAAIGRGKFTLTASQSSLTTEHLCHGIRASMEVRVHPDESAEIRTLRLENLSGFEAVLELTSCIEIALAHPMGDRSHPAFSKLFVQTSVEKETGILTASRRPRAAGETWPVMVHAMSGSPVEAWETDRLRFIGRGRSLRAPALRMEGTAGNVLDPLFALRTTVRLAPGESLTLTWMLGTAADVPAARGLVQRVLPGCIAMPFAAPAEEAAPEVQCEPANEGSAFRIHLPWRNGAHVLPPMPWSNVLANPGFGCLITERGSGCTWSRNSQANRITPWSNDPVSDPHHEAIWLQDESGKCWSPMPGPMPPPADVTVHHGHGWSSWEVNVHALRHRVLTFVPPDDPVRCTVLTLTNDSDSPRRVRVLSWQRLVLGTLPRASGGIRTWLEEPGTLFAQRAQADEFSNGIAFSALVATDATDAQFTTDRRSFFGESGDICEPLALAGTALDSRTGSDVDAGFAWSTELIIPPGQSVEWALVTGEAQSREAVEALVCRYRQRGEIGAAEKRMTAFWEGLLGGIRVRTPVPAIDHLVNGWLPYQTLACRMWGRTAFYQSGGAFGYRDQLQDAGNLVLLRPGLAREQILLHAAHQFTEGDVLHWWHPAPMERGVRTRFSDDLLWLPFVTAAYVRATGDAGFLAEQVPFLTGPLLEPGQEENYFQPEVSAESASVLEHCCRAIDRSLATGAHGLPLMGTGDWNDGMNRVGREGRGESIWLGFFLHTILTDFISLPAMAAEPARAERYAAALPRLAEALNTHGWDGAWYRRAYYDDGTPMGTASAAECRIDGLAQAWAVLSGVAPEDIAASAMKAMQEQLISSSDGLLRLLTPPFEHSAEDPGYIKGYVAGVRENGGQYTHAACWMVQAMARRKMRREAVDALALLSPLRHASSAEAMQRYKVEPYVIAADVYGAAPHIGRGGWTWYTGSAGWAFRVALESILGLRMESATVVIDPCIPDEWPEYQIDFRHPLTGTMLHIRIANPHGSAATIVSASVDGTEIPVQEGIVRIAPPASGVCHVGIILGPGNG